MILLYRQGFDHVELYQYQRELYCLGLVKDTKKLDYLILITANSSLHWLMFLFVLLLFMINIHFFLVCVRIKLTTFK